MGRGRCPQRDTPGLEARGELTLVHEGCALGSEVVSVGESACAGLSFSLGDGHGEKETGGEGRTFPNVPALTLPHCPEHQQTHPPGYRSCEVYKLAGEKNICMWAHRCFAASASC
jgi:hypothetical protein